MMKKFAAIVCLSLPLLGTAATDKAANPAASAPKVKAPAARKPASPQAPQAPTRTNKDEQARMQSRGALMGACQKKAGDQQLGGVERKQFLGNCMKGK